MCVCVCVCVSMSFWRCLQVVTLTSLRQEDSDALLRTATSKSYLGLLTYMWEMGCWLTGVKLTAVSSCAPVTGVETRPDPCVPQVGGDTHTHTHTWAHTHTHTHTHMRTGAHTHAGAPSVVDEMLIRTYSEVLRVCVFVHVRMCACVCVFVRVCA